MRYFKINDEIIRIPEQYLNIDADSILEIEENCDTSILNCRVNYDEDIKKYYLLDSEYVDITDRYDWENMESIDYEKRLYKLGELNYYNKLYKYVLLINNYEIFEIIENDDDIISYFGKKTYFYYNNFYNGSKADFINNLSDDVYILYETPYERCSNILDKYFLYITLEEFNKDNDTNFSSVEEVVEYDIEYNFTREQVADWLWDCNE